jgi:hypothetical protein
MTAPNHTIRDKYFGPESEAILHNDALQMFDAAIAKVRMSLHENTAQNSFYLGWIADSLTGMVDVSEETAKAIGQEILSKKENGTIMSQAEIQTAVAGRFGVPFVATFVKTTEGYVGLATIT